jgi:carbon-monoxide dehydrogenase small subunit
MLMSAYGLLKKVKEPTEEQIKKAISGNLCRCTGYLNIVAAIKEAAANFAG